MNAIERIKTAADLPLLPNPYLADPSIPYLYQRRGALMMVARPRLLLGDDVGLGKTLQTVVASTYLKARKERTKFLVLTEVAAMRQWQAEYRWLAPEMSTQIIGAVSGDAEARDHLFETTDADVLISSYSMMYRHPEAIRACLGRGGGYVVVCDEAPFRNPKSGISTLAKELMLEAERAYALTATLVEGNLREAFGLYDTLVPGLIPSKSFFVRRWCLTEPARWKFVNGKRVPLPWPVKVVGYKNLQDFKAWISRCFYARLQTNPEVQQQLPDVITSHVPVPLGYDQSRKVIEAEKGVLALPSGVESEMLAIERLMRCQQLVDDPRILGAPHQGAKMDVLLEQLQGSLKGQSVIVFTRFAKVANLIREELKAKKIGSEMIQGGMTQGARAKAQDRFQDGTTKVLVITLAGGRALNLQKGGHLIFFDGPWLYGQERQLIGRIKRTGSDHRHVVAHYYLGELHPRAAREARIRHQTTIDHHVLRVRAVGERLFHAIVGDSGEDVVEKEKTIAGWVIADMKQDAATLQRIIDGDYDVDLH